MMMMMMNRVFRWHRFCVGVCLALLVTTGLAWSPATMAAPGDQHAVTVSSASSEASDTAYLDDTSNVFTPAQEFALVRRLREASTKHNIQFTVVFGPLTAPTVAATAEQHFDRHNLGYGSRHDGLLLYVSVGSRDMHLLSNGKAHDILRRVGLRRIGISVRNVLSTDQWFDAVLEFISAGDKEFSPYMGRSFIIPRDLTELLPALLIGLIGAGAASRYSQRKVHERIRTTRRSSTDPSPVFLSFGIDEHSDTLIRSRSTSREIVHYTYDDDDSDPVSFFSSGRSSSSSSSSGGWRSSSSSSRGGFSSKF